MEIISWGIDNAKVNSVANDFVESLFDDWDEVEREGSIRRLFASAITPNGYVNYLSSLLKVDRLYTLKGKPGTGTEKVISKVMEAASSKGFDVEAYFCALNPQKVEHLIIPELNVAFTTSNEYHNCNEKNFMEIDLDEFIDQKILDKYKDELEYNKKQFDSIMERAIKTIASAKKLHDRMEAYYIPNMDYEAIQTCYEVTLARILECEE